jgi:hypothetical protein
VLKLGAFYLNYAQINWDLGLALVLGREPGTVVAVAADMLEEEEAGKLAVVAGIQVADHSQNDDDDRSRQQRTAFLPKSKYA